VIGKPPPPDEQGRVAELLRLLASLRCLDSSVYVQVDDETFEHFLGRAHVISGDDGTGFRSKRVLRIPNTSGAPGSSVEVVLWTAPQRRLQVA
jgi:hypothetical protein